MDASLLKEMASKSALIFFIEFFELLALSGTLIILFEKFHITGPLYHARSVYQIRTCTCITI